MNEALPKVSTICWIFNGPDIQRLSSPILEHRCFPRVHHPAESLYTSGCLVGGIAGIDDGEFFVSINVMAKQAGIS